VRRRTDARDQSFRRACLQTAGASAGIDDRLPGIGIRHETRVLPIAVAGDMFRRSNGALWGRAGR